ncbi:hypothetical protein CAEBREN_26094 [Caenorhabditis brenneri]|uniref:Uncharacterized protein n=1 Tax=Caenorhabditis brenneri TaxID=135651 RepID=G0MQ67_CAEBE|nr:hypothetical protein CAEBREN_26094 [Caenorhabditis brenneri]
MRIRKRDPLLLITLFSLISPIVSTVPKEFTDPCLDGENIDPFVMTMPPRFANLTPPWIRADGTFAKITKSNGLSYQWSWLKSLDVKGLTKRVDDVIGFLTDNECFFVPIGPSVRSSILGQKAVYLSGEVSCELHELYDKCIAAFGATECSLYPIEDGGWGAYRLEIGDASSNRSTFEMRAEPIVLHEWRSLIGSTPDKWRFTVDMLALFDNGAGGVYAIDPSQKGYGHLCEKKLAPATEDWAEWSRNQPVKIMGFYELKSNGFSAKNESLHTFINNEVKVMDKRQAQKFYCENVLKGVANLEGSTPICHTKFPQRDDQKWIVTMRNTMMSEMGKNWNTSMGAAAEELEAVFCTDRQFVDIRSRLLHKVTSSYDGTLITQKPKLIEEGRPMIKDSAQVHSRPILEMSGQEPPLPPEYPNSPRAQPNEHLEFVEPPVEGAGMDPIAIQVHRSMDPDEAEQEEDLEASRAEIGVTAEPPPNDLHLQNQMHDDLPVMRFDKVEENGLPDVAASAMDMREMSSGAAFFSSISIPFLIVLLYSLIL